MIFLWPAMEMKPGHNETTSHVVSTVFRLLEDRNAQDAVVVYAPEVANLGKFKGFYSPFHCIGPGWAFSDSKVGNLVEAIGYYAYVELEVVPYVSI